MTYSTEMLKNRRRCWGFIFRIKKKKADCKSCRCDDLVYTSVKKAMGGAEQDHGSMGVGLSIFQGCLSVVTF